MKRVYIEDTLAPYQYNVRDYKTGELLGYTDKVGVIEADINHKWLDVPEEVIVVEIYEDLEK